MTSWNDTTHFCEWYGVTCGKLHQRVTELNLYSLQLRGSISPHIGNLTFLRVLGLDNNSLTNQIPPEMGNLRRLKRLYLDSNSLGGEIPSNLSKCSKLVLLHLADNLLVGEIPKELGLLSKLQYLLLFDNNLTGEIPPSLGNLSSLGFLSATRSNLVGSIPHTLGRLDQLTLLVLAENQLSGTVPCSMFNLSSITVLALGNLYLQGYLPSDLFFTLPNLIILSVQQNQFTGPIPTSLSNASNLGSLDLGGNFFIGKVPSLQKLNLLNGLSIYNNSLGAGGHDDLNFLCSLTNATDLQQLHIGMNNLGGSLPECISNLSSKLTVFRLNDNDISGSIPVGIGNLVSLALLEAFSNKLSGKVPSLQKLNALEVLSISNNSLGTTGSNDLDFLCSLTNATDLQILNIGINNLGGSIPECISNLSSKLTDFLLQYNHICGSIPAGITNLVSLMKFTVSANKLSGKVPSLKKLSNLHFLFIAGNSLGTRGPNDLGFLCTLTNASDLGVLDARYNNFGGSLPECINNSTSKVTALFLFYNHISGSIPSGIPNSLAGLFIANNNLHGRIPLSLCNATKLDILDLADNHLNGTIPSCLISLSQTLGLLNLGGNNIAGTIPDKFVKGCKLAALNFNGNFLQGQIPRSLANCKGLNLLDLGNNQLSGTFPCELKTLIELQVLVIKSNKFSGIVACLGKDSIWPSLQILHLASNHFSGEITSQFVSQWRLMMARAKEPQTMPDLLYYYSKVFDVVFYYQDSVTLTFKNNDFLMPDVLKSFTSIDLSNNDFHGEIPKELGNLNALIVLKLSHNSLSGNIQSSFGNLSQLESLDLSCTALSGNIPSELGNLNFLESLNLSFNKLVGPIPTSTQLQTFDASSYQGNAGLYGPPLTPRNIPRSIQPAAPDGSQWGSKSELEWMLRGAGVGFPVGLTIFVGPLLYIKRWRRWYCKHIGSLAMKILGREEQSKGRRRRSRKLRQGRQSG